MYICIYIYIYIYIYVCVCVYRRLRPWLRFAPVLTRWLLPLAAPEDRDLSTGRVSKRMTGQELQLIIRHQAMQVQMNDPVRERERVSCTV